MASTKIQPFKFYNPGTSSIKSPVVLAARKQVLATNRLGKTVEGIGSLVKDIEMINIKMVKNDKLRERVQNRMDSLDDSLTSKMKTLEEDINNKVKKALNNPLSKM